MPGDVRIEGERTSFYAPITSMILLSVVVVVESAVLLMLLAISLRSPQPARADAVASRREG